MTTLTLNNEIFTAEHIEHISKVKTNTPNISGDTYYTIKDYVINYNPHRHVQITPSVEFTISLISGKEFKKKLYYKDLHDEVKQEVVSTAERIEKECGVDKLEELKQKKGEIIMNQQYEAAAELRDQERKLVEAVAETGYADRISKEVIEDIIIKNLYTIAENKRLWLKEIIDKTKPPLEI